MTNIFMELEPFAAIYSKRIKFYPRYMIDNEENIIKWWVDRYKIYSIAQCLSKTS